MGVVHANVNLWMMNKLIMTNNILGLMVSVAAVCIVTLVCNGMVDFGLSRYMSLKYLSVDSTGTTRFQMSFSLA